MLAQLVLILLFLILLAGTSKTFSTTLAESAVMTTSSENSTSSRLGEINREFWDVQGDSIYNQEWVQRLSQQIGDFLRASAGWIGIEPATHANGGDAAPVRMLDYACGFGAASRALAPYVTELRGIDVSDGMVEKFNRAARKQGISERQMYAVRGDLLATSGTFPALQAEDFFNFDVIVMSMALHHIGDPQEMLTKLVERLRERGSIVITDWTVEHQNDETEPLQQHQQPQQEVAGDGVEDSHGHHHPQSHEHGHGQHSISHTVAHGAFTKHQMVTMLRRAGCDEVDLILLPESNSDSWMFGDRKIFFARGKKVTNAASRG